MECNNVRELLSLYIDNMLDDEQMREVEKHLATCDACKKEMEELSDMVALLSELEEYEVPEEFNIRMKTALSQEVRKAKLINKNRWRMFTSIAAVFAVFVLSMGVFKDTLSIFPEKLAGDQQAESSYMAEGSDDLDSTQGETEALAEENMAKTLTGSGLDDSMVAMAMEEVPVELKESPKSKSNNSYVENDETVENYNTESMYDTSNEESAEADSNEVYSLSAETPDSSNNNVRAFGSGTLSGSKKQCTRASLSSNVERNTAAVQYYSDLITQKLENYDYQILSSKYIESGEWHFKVLIFRGKDGTTFNEEIIIIGKDGEIKVIAKNEAMGL